jgi:hypothetical protein
MNGRFRLKPEINIPAALAKIPSEKSKITNILNRKFQTVPKQLKLTHNFWKNDVVECFCN